MRIAKNQILNRLYDTCNLIGEDVDIDHEIMKYKTLQAESDEVKDIIYRYVVERMGLCDKEYTNEEELRKLEILGY